VSYRAGLLLGAIAAVLTAALLAPRADRGLLAFVVLAGSTASVLGPLLAGIAQARPLGRVTLALLTGLGLAALPLSFVGTLLKATTNHRPLGAVTFAFSALVVVPFVLLLSVRLFSFLETKLNERQRAIAFVTVGLLAAVGPVVLLLRMLGSPALAIGLADVAIALGIGALGLRIQWPSALQRVAQGAGFWAWLLVVLLGAGVAVFGDSAPAAAASTVLLAPFAWFLG
jgi:hypothetical protein